ncbi:MAG: hypothetical protein ACFHWX_09195 [Bacteroidota bacterium]
MRTLIYAVVIIAMVSCEKKRSPERLESLIRLNESMASTNIRELNRLKEAVETSGNRTLDEQMLDELEMIIPYFLHYSNDDELFKSIEALDSISGTDMWYRTEEIRGQMAMIKNMSEVYKESRDSLDLELIKGGLNILQASFIKDRQIKITYGTFDPLPVRFFMNQDSLAIGKTSQIILTLGKPLDETLFGLKEAALSITFDDLTINDYELKQMGQGSWIVSFVPDRSGKYILHFNGDIMATVDNVAIRYPFNGRQELLVK